MIPKTKHECRTFFRKKRKEVSLLRRQEAMQSLLERVPFETFPKVASFASMLDEIDLSALNTQLADQGKLLLPRIAGAHLEFYSVRNCETEIQPGTPPQPDPTQCQRIELTGDELLLVPGLAFDSEHFRVGYGKGHYDLLLARYPNVYSLGIAFLEQFSEELLPRNSWDEPVHDVLYL